VRKELDYARKIETKSPYAQVDASNLVNLSTSQRKSRYKRVNAQIILRFFEEIRIISHWQQEQLKKKTEITEETRRNAQRKQETLEDNA